MLTIIKFLFLFLFIFFIGLFFILSSGIYIEKFSFASINISKLYIKLDKKLIVRIEELTIPATSTTQNADQSVKTYIEYLPILLTVFETIDIELLKFQNNKFTITVDKSIFYIDNNFINISAQPMVKDKIITLDLYSLLIKKHNVLFDGILKANLNTNNILFTGRMFYKELNIGLNTITNKNKIDFVIDSFTDFSSIKFVKDFIDLHPIIESWMYDNVKGSINLNYLKGQLDRNTYMPIISSLEGLATIKEAQVTFHKELEPVHVPLLNVSFKKDNLYFDLEKPTYKDIDIEGSNVVIYSLSKEKKSSNIIIEIKTKHHLNQDILDILKAYNITLPIIQLSGTTNSQLAIQIYFKDNSLLTKGVFETTNSNFSLNGFDFFANTALVELDNKDVKIKNADVRVDKLFDATLNLNIDTQTKLAKGEAEVKNFSIKSQQLDLIAIDTIFTDVHIDYTEFTQIALPQLFTEISILKDFTHINLDNLSFVNEHSPLLKNLNIKEGSLDINLYDKENIDFKATLKNLDFPIYTKENEKLTEASISGKISNNKVIINSSDEKIKMDINGNKSLITLENLDLMNENDTLLKADSPLSIEIKGNNSNILLNEKQKILADSYVLLLKNNTLDFTLTHKGGKLTYAKNKNSQINLKSEYMSDQFMNNLLGIENFFNGGDFDLKAKGTSELLEGNITITNSKIKQLALLNNLITFVNLTPAIINPLLAIPPVFGMLTNKGFNLAGYRVMEGNLDFSYNLKEELFYIDQLHAVGNVADFKVTGVIDLNKKEIDSEVVIIFLKDYSKIIGYIPILNHIFLDDEKNISTKVKVFGSLEDPQIQTILTRDIDENSSNSTKELPSYLLKK